ncbi:thioredoxin-like protein [Pavlovales sp. CCMP2436]|nr:thioredoxin-like protein [Pavlovales sp. CCMP2436]
MATATATDGSAVPSVTFKTRVRIDSKDPNPFDWKDVSSEDLFKGKRVVLFSLPGAFTPTCSSFQLPGYEAAYEQMKALGIDDVYCLSVNDAFVMRQWGLKQGMAEDMTFGANGFTKVKLLPDGACLFTRGMGMSTLWEKERGFGERSWRYSCVINDMKVRLFYRRIVLSTSPYIRVDLEVPLRVYISIKTSGPVNGLPVSQWCINNTLLA